MHKQCIIFKAKTYLLTFSSMVSSIAIYCLHTVKWLQVLLSNTNNSIQHYSFACRHLKGFKY